MAGDQIVRLSGMIPSPFAFAILLTFVAGGVALAFGDLGPAALLDAWAAGDSGFWSFLGFGMQMTLILITGTVVAESPWMRRGLGLLAERPRNAVEATVMVALVAMGLSLLHWGLGLIAGAVLAREVGQTAPARGVRLHYPTLAAGGYAGILVWHGGLSGSAPLKMTNEADRVEVLGEALAARVAELPLSATVLSPRNLMVTALLLVVIPTVLAALVPSDPNNYVAPPTFPEEEEPTEVDGNPLDTGPWLVVPMVVLMGAWIASWLAKGGWQSLSPNALNFVFFAIGFALAGSPARYMALARKGAAASTGILVQFPVYAGIRGLLVASGVGAKLAAASLGSVTLSTFVLAGLLNLFVPSGGGQWGIQGPLAISAAVDQGVPVEHVVLAFAWGDQWTNAFQPFWALPLLGITGAKAGDLLACTVVVGLAAGLVMLFAVLM